MSVFRTSTAVVAAAGLLALGACTSGGGSTGSSTAGSTGAAAGGPIAVTATDTECTVSGATAAAGTITFQVKNTGSKVNEFYLYGAGDRIVSEVENITPGLTRELKVEVTEPALYAANVGSYDETYGSRGGVVVLLLWLYITAFVVVLGAEINAALETLTVRDSTTGPDAPLGQRGAVAADSVPTSSGTR